MGFNARKPWDKPLKPELIPDPKKDAYSSQVDVDIEGTHPERNGFDFRSQE
jgi:hypothetical protein